MTERSTKPRPISRWTGSALQPAPTAGTSQLITMTVTSTLCPTGKRRYPSLSKKSTQVPSRLLRGRRRQWHLFKVLSRRIFAKPGNLSMTATCPITKSLVGLFMVTRELWPEQVCHDVFKLAAKKPSSKILFCFIFNLLGRNSFSPLSTQQNRSVSKSMINLYNTEPKRPIITRKSTTGTSTSTETCPPRRTPVADISYSTAPPPQKPERKKKKSKEGPQTLSMRE